ncbi:MULTISPECIES: super-infection exclusion protein B [Yersinia]|uniref:super-infection exclusion protein B n=1 Tax=Yersinia TaxID=629 RepID=UPI00119EC694|nr:MULTISPECIES: super-infection exclusion protein B [Yersinia]MBW5816852.1 super-infection exclusion protein B [Yersinia kristensenii]MBW5843089.1 super-infection exclusion protein B [Yersinia kristensenii]MBW5860547.1 super-infection exclusion protein B [Yersinia enterocolitica]MBW5873605.1 super-infection exclusion protein B [Yersinia enterocolitica]MDA5489501.1 super-infection exclusion protein B [Yersinia kristensenii]
MPDFIGLLSKLFSNEPLERLMYMVIIFIAALFLLPKGYVQLINEKVGIPYACHIFIFAISFVLAVNIQRIFLLCRFKISSYLNERQEKQQTKYIHQVIDSLTEGQRKILITALSRQYSVIHENRQNSDIKALVDFGVLIPQQGQLLPHENPYSVLYVSEIYWAFLMSRWNAYSGELN